MSKQIVRLLVLVMPAILLIIGTGLSITGNESQAPLAERRTDRPREKPAAPALIAQSRHASQPAVAAAPDTGEVLEWHVITAAVTGASSGDYSLIAGVGEMAVGESSSPTYSLTGGFWDFYAETSCCVGVAGNADGDPDEICDISDLTKIIDYLFITYTEPECMPEANTDGSLDGICDISDLTKVIDYLFITYTPPAPCL